MSAMVLTPARDSDFSRPGFLTARISHGLNSCPRPVAGRESLPRFHVPRVRGLRFHAFTPLHFRVWDKGWAGVGGALSASTRPRFRATQSRFRAFALPHFRASAFPGFHAPTFLCRERFSRFCNSTLSHFGISRLPCSHVFMPN